MNVPAGNYGYQAIPDQHFTLNPNITFNQIDNRKVDGGVINILEYTNPVLS